MKRLFALTFAGAVGVAAMAQEVTPIPPSINPVPVDGPIPGFPYQDRGAKVLGDVRNGPPLAPTGHFGGIPPPVLPWGPRAYASTGRMLNFSFRGLVGKGDQVVVAGFVVSEGDRVMLIRAVGPTLVSFGLTGVLSRPQLELLDVAGKRVALAVPWSATSNDTQEELRKAGAAVGAFALKEGSEDQVLLVYLKRGLYTAVVSGVDGTTGLVLLEGYEVPRAPGSLDNG